jgi:hypothetical protein
LLLLAFLQSGCALLLYFIRSEQVTLVNTVIVLLALDSMARFKRAGVCVASLTPT